MRYIRIEFGVQKSGLGSEDALGRERGDGGLWDGFNMKI